MKTTQEILQEIDRRGLDFGCNRVGVNAAETIWYVRVSAQYRLARRAATFEAALALAWAAYEGAAP